MTRSETELLHEIGIIEAAIRDLDERRADLATKKKAVRHQLSQAKARARYKAAHGTSDSSSSPLSHQLHATQCKLRALRLAASWALRAKGATVAEVEEILDITSATLRFHRLRESREKEKELRLERLRKEKEEGGESKP